MINDQLAISLQDWLQDTSFPDEHFYSTLASVKSYNFMVQYFSVDLTVDPTS